jgi:hypothetical protein
MIQACNNGRAVRHIQSLQNGLLVQCRAWPHIA